MGSGKFVVTAASGNTATLGSLGVGTTLAVTGAATLSGALGVTGLTTLTAVTASGDVTVGSNAVVVTAAYGNTAIAGTLSAGATTLSSTLAVSSATTLSGTLALTGLATLKDSIVMEKGVSAITHTANAAADSGLTIKSNNGYVYVEGIQFTGAAIGINGDPDLITMTDSNVEIKGALKVNSGSADTFTVTAANGNTATLGSLGVGTTLAVTGAATLSSTLGVTGLTTLAAVNVGGDVNVGSGKFTCCGCVTATPPSQAP